MKRKKMEKWAVSFLGLTLLLCIGMSLPVKANTQGNESQQVIVEYKNIQGKAAALNNSQKVEKQYQNVPAVAVSMTQEAIDNLKNNPNVARVEPNVRFKVSDDQLRPYNISSVSSGTTSATTAEESQWDLQASQSPLAWSEGITGKGVKVAILDTGIASHPDLNIAGGVSMVSYTTSFLDDDGHGTNIAGFVGALRNGKGMVGMAPDVQLFSVKVLDNTGQGYLSDVLSGIDWAITNHMNIINLSFGTTSDSQLLHDMVDKAYANGVLVVCASGNLGNDLGTGDNVTYPAKYSSALSVSAVDRNMVRAPFSSTGNKIDFSAGGVDVASTYLNGSYAIGSGTSQAAPHVTGLLALLKQKYPTKTNDELVGILKSFAKDLGAPGKDAWYGDGFAQYQTTAPSTTVTSGVSLISRGYIDTPAFGSTLNGDANVSGWFLDGSGVSKIEVLVDGISMGTAQYGSVRSDVEKVFPEYQNANSGFQYTLDTKSLSNGPHVLTVRETGNNGAVTGLNSVNVNVLNLPAIGCIDTPKNGSVIKGNTTLSGWFLDQKGVSRVEILVDGQTAGTAAYGSSRLDVQKVYPQYQNANSGYQYLLDTTKMTDGQHTLTVREIGMDGTITILPDVKVTVQNYPPIGYTDTPAFGSTLTGDAKVSGWFLDGSGVSKIEVLVDGTSVGIAQYGSARSDVEKAFPGYQNANSGFQFTLNTKNLSNGPHVLSVRETGNNGIVTALNNVNVNVLNLPAIGCIDTPKNGSVIKGNTTLSGWFLDQKGVSRVEILVDGQTAGTAAYGSSRLDVQKVYPQYQNANSGYQYLLDTTKMTDGQHTLTVREIGMDGTITILPDVKVTVQNYPPIGYMDAPAFGSTVNGEAKVSGWFLDGSGVSKIEVLVDGTSMGTAQYGSARSDVDKAFPGYQNANSGFQYTLNTKNLSNGQHVLTVRETGNSGAVTVLNSVNVNVLNLPAIGCIDTPKNGSVIKGNTTLSGWFLDQTGVSRIEILVDGQTAGTATYGSSRLDVQKVYPQYQNANSGYQYLLDTTKMTDGAHTLTVREIGMDGTITILPDVKVTVQNYYPSKGCIDTPSSGSIISGEANVSGWFLDGSGVSEIEVLVDGISVGTAQYGGARSDVEKVFPEYQNANSGFQFTLNTTQITNGQHTLAVKETGANGLTLTLTSQVTVKN